ncbi:PH domain-containing protein [Rubripirellula amarantea]|uniref:Bacterial membrane flanked domain protein n=1 Tax=Rubripirellula amarantea TaxID=2527999 RepID=A0A5C5WRJ0_9BACT|nr:PH domain-containing protein [Rubripirellula amarantea]MDA8744696.1 PH domain-containing protein [Rubripirellula amarantea]TWT52741.1 Bacterial membrane flanked domain protein [Rubripirellula amarantea]
MSEPDGQPKPIDQADVTQAPPSRPTAGEKFQDSIAAKKQAELDHDEAEETVWTGGFSPKAMVGTWLAMALLSVLILVLAGLFEPFTWMMAIGAIVVLWAVGAIRYAARRLGYHYELTNQRFIHQSGILHRQTDRIEVIDIDDVSFNQGPIERMFDVGTINLTGSDRTHPSLTMLGIANVRNVSGLIDDIRRKERRRRSLHIESI